MGNLLAYQLKLIGLLQLNHNIVNIYRVYKKNVIELQRAIVIVSELLCA